jgi:hypothetical protein
VRVSGAPADGGWWRAPGPGGSATTSAFVSSYCVLTTPAVSAPLRL